ncbi:MAG: electron transfer flavoprotein subunit alpha, partial [Sutterella wadsworthensis]|nr:electron transfer flavoprotein subunit alpha [Sutterella wadsworthensis]
MKQINTVWVFADAADRYADLITGAKKTGAKVNAVVVSEAGVQALRASGPDAVYNLDVAAESCVENYAASLAAVIAGEGNLVLLDVTKRSKAFAAALSQKLGAALVNDALSLNPAADGLRVTFRTYGGLAVGTEKVLSANAVVTVSGGVFAPEAAESYADLAVTKVAYVAPANALVVKERRAKAQSAVDLTKAKRVVG